LEESRPGGVTSGEEKGAFYKERNKKCKSEGGGRKKGKAGRKGGFASTSCVTKYKLLREKGGDIR